MAGIVTRPQLRGTLARASQWSVLYAQANLRVYPYQLGCFVRTTEASPATSINTEGHGEFAVNDYLIACSVDANGHFTPDTDRISRVDSGGVGGTNATATLTLVGTNPITVTAGEYLLNLGADGGSDPFTSPTYGSGSDLTLYSDPITDTTTGLTYLTTGVGGFFSGWVQTGYTLVDLLITNSSAAPLGAMPLIALGPEASI